MSDQPNRLPADAAHGFGGTAIDRGRPLTFRLNGRSVHGFHGDTILTALLASGIDSAGVDGETPLALSEDFCPPVYLSRTSLALPMDRTPALDGLDLVTMGIRVRESAFDRLLRRPRTTLGHRFDREPLRSPWTLQSPTVALDADLVVVGGGIAGLSAAEAAAGGGLKVVLVERRPWLGGDARYFGPVGNDETPEALTVRLSERLAASATAILTSSDAFDISDQSVVVYRVEVKDGKPVGTIVRINAPHVILATGCRQRLPLMTGNRLPGVVASVAAYHRAKRYGVWRGRHAVFAVQGNFPYRLALRAHDAGIAIARIVDTRLNPQSRFVDFAKATGLTLSSGITPAAVMAGSEGSMALLARGGGGAEQTFAVPSGQIVVSGSWQPELSLWMRAGGASRWDSSRHALVATGRLDHATLAGSVAGIETTMGAVASGRAAVAALLNKAPEPIDDKPIDPAFETPDAATPAIERSTGRAYLDTGASLIVRPIVSPDGVAPATNDAKPLSLGDVAASVEIGLIDPADAGIIAEERGAAGTVIAPAEWSPPAVPDDVTGYLEGRFGAEPVRARVTVDRKRKFEIGALIYANTDEHEPTLALGAIVESASEGGIALFESAALKKIDRFVIRTSRGPAPLRIVERLQNPVTMPAD